MWDIIKQVMQLVTPLAAGIGGPLLAQALAPKPKMPGMGAGPGGGPGGPGQAVGGPVSGTPAPRQTALNFAGGFTGGQPLGNQDTARPVSSGFQIPTPGTRPLDASTV